MDCSCTVSCIHSAQGMCSLNTSSLYLFTPTHHAQQTNTQHTHTLTHIQSHTIHLSTAPSDYDTLAGFSLGPFSNSVRQLSFNVPIVNDTFPEDDEDFTASLTLSPADGARLGTRVTVDPDLATVTIEDDDGTLPY